MSRYDDILARLRAAKGPDRELDAMIIVALADGKQMKIGRKPGTITEHYYPGTWGTRTAKTVTASIDAASALPERLIGLEWAITKLGHCYEGRVMSGRFASWTIAEAPTAPLAILIALFEALKQKEAANG